MPSSRIWPTVTSRSTTGCQRHKAFGNCSRPSICQALLGGPQINEKFCGALLLDFASLNALMLQYMKRLFLEDSKMKSLPHQMTKSQDVLQEEKIKKSPLSSESRFQYNTWNSTCASSKTCTVRHTQRSEQAVATQGRSQ